MSDHELLPWQLNGTLDPKERLRLEEHLSSCSSCAQESIFLRSLQEQIRIHGEAFFSAHPAPEVIVAGALEQLAETQDEELRRHLGLCATCGMEIRIIREGQKSIHSMAAPSPLRGRVWRRALPWAVVAGVTLAILIPLWQRLQPRAPGSDLVSATYLEPPQRGGLNQVQVAPETIHFQLVIPVDLPEVGASLSLEIRDSSGRVILVREGVKDLYRDRFLMVLCDRNDFPDGNYRVLLRSTAPQGGPALEKTEIPFQVQTQPQK